ncbi:MAG: STAS domain-containing protein [Clostridiales bacterium]|nr:STAS domain-containing protein [Clostridiales bacterium]
MDYFKTDTKIDHIEMDISFNYKNKYWHIKISQEINMFNSRNMRSEIMRAVQKKDADVVINCKRVTYMDSGALNAFVLLSKSMHYKNKRISVEDLSPSIEKLFRIANLNSILKIDKNNRQ